MTPQSSMMKSSVNPNSSKSELSTASAKSMLFNLSSPFSQICVAVARKKQSTLSIGIDICLIQTYYNIIRLKITKFKVANSQQVFQQLIDFINTLLWLVSLQTNSIQFFCYRSSLGLNMDTRKILYYLFLNFSRSVGFES